jgi:hypothetical protein
MGKEIVSLDGVGVGVVVDGDVVGLDEIALRIWRRACDRVRDAAALVAEAEVIEAA